MQFESRDIITSEQRKLILGKSDGKCCRCGKGLKLKNMTVDHYIPLSKGGTNKLENLFPLCKDCNEKKSNKVLMPEEYIKYIKPEHQKEIKSLYKDFCNDVKWYKLTNLTREDSTIISYPVEIPSLMGHQKKGLNEMPYTGNAVLEKVKYEDLDEIYEYASKYMDKYGLDKSGLKESMTANFRYGSMYTLRNSSGLLGVIPIRVEAIEIQFSGTEPRKYYVYAIDGIPMLYQNEKYIMLLYYALGYIFKNLADLTSEKSIALNVSYPTKDEFLKYFFHKLEIEEVDGKDETEDWSSSLCLLSFEGRDEWIANYERKTTRSDLMLKFSNNLERLFKLPKIDYKKEEFDITKKGTVKEKAASRSYRKNHRTSPSIKATNNAYKRKKAQERDGDYEREMRKYIG